MARITGDHLTGFLVGLGLVGVLLTVWLVVSELFRESTCPPLFGIPACYLVLAAYVAATAGAWIGPVGIADAMFWTGGGAVTAIGVYFSQGQIRGAIECPTFEGLPMCFVSLFAGLTLLAAGGLRRRQARAARSTILKQ